MRKMVMRARWGRRREVEERDAFSLAFSFSLISQIHIYKNSHGLHADMCKIVSSCYPFQNEKQMLSA